MSLMLLKVRMHSGCCKNLKLDLEKYLGLIPKKLTLVGFKINIVIIIVALLKNNIKQFRSKPMCPYLKVTNT